MKVKVKRNLTTETGRKFWDEAQKSAEEVCTWPDWRRAGINVAQLRKEPRKLDEDKEEAWEE